MNANDFAKRHLELIELCTNVKMLIGMGSIQKCKNLILHAMGRYPHAPEPHNLIGILLEMEGDHPMAMKHFRAAVALAPDYLPARQNLESFGTFYSRGTYAYNENDCRTSANEPNSDSEEYSHPVIDHTTRRPEYESLQDQTH